jgi:hypothetical protein
MIVVEPEAFDGRGRRGGGARGKQWQQGNHEPTHHHLPLNKTA